MPANPHEPTAIDQQSAHTRVGSYAVCVQDGQVLLTRYTGPRRWGLPGGGLDHGEDPIEGVFREVWEETGHLVRVDRLLGVHSIVWDKTDTHAINLVYQVGIVGGALRPEVDGSSDLAAWFDLDDVDQLERSLIVDFGIGLWQNPSAIGRPSEHRVDERN